MLLKEVRLQNIRSYLDATITFPEKTSLLSGDIGSGKTTILLAIEFALFGTSRPDLPAEALLRKGTNQGEVELSFTLKGNQIQIKRKIKRDKNGIKQLPGHIIINNRKKELMPIEMKSEVITLLGYPPEFISKNKNYIFRYTVYTPQEEMKYILQENSEVRLDVLRKIFNIDKYKVIRENIQIYLKQMRNTITILKTKIEPLEDLKKNLIELEGKKSELVNSKELLDPKLQRVREEVEKLSTNLQRIEKEQNEFLEFKRLRETNITLLSEKEKHLQQQWARNEHLTLEISLLKLPQDVKVEVVKDELLKIERQKNKILEKRSSLQEKINSLQKYIRETEKEIAETSSKTITVPEKERIVRQLTEEVKEKQTLSVEKDESEKTLQEIVNLISKSEALLLQAKELHEKISSLDNCPTCLQEVSIDHKHKISTEEKEKIQKSEIQLIELNEQKTKILLQKMEVENKILQIVDKENLLTKTKLELTQLNEKKQWIENKQTQLKLSIKENNQLMEELTSESKDEDIQNLEKERKEKQTILDMILKKEQLQQQLKEVVKQIENDSRELDILRQSQKEINERLANRKDLSEDLLSEKDNQTKLQEEEKSQSIKLAEIRTKIDNHETQIQQANEKITKISEEKNKLLRFQELHHWLEEHMVNLTYTIEKHVMVNIHQLFNQLFQEWFSMLIDDDNVHARIDDSFTPIIEQNGHEILFANLSGGERTSAALAYRLSLNKVINDIIQRVKTKNILILDEPTDGFSSEQLDKVRDVLEKLDLKQTIIVSHESKIESFVSNVIRVKKEDHISVIQNN